MLEWVLRRCDGEDIVKFSLIGFIFKNDLINVEGFGELNMKELFSIFKNYWLEECRFLR